MDDVAEDAHGPDIDPAAHDEARLRGPKRLLLFGSVVALLLALGTGALGADGRASFVLLLLLLAAVFGLTGAWVGVQLLVDEFRGAPTSLRRGLLTAGMFVATLVCMTAVSGLGQTLGGTS